MLHRLMPEPGCTVRCTVQLEDGLSFKRKYVSYLLMTVTSSRLTIDKGVSLVLKCQDRMTARARQMICEIVVVTMGEVKRLLTLLFSWVGC